ncbi:MAG: SDR family oxidoreductase [Polaromonas sp.]|uniref:SDR family NAD(P)-dependent oxidoreductase n=1 Tax=Polaromonas sp. TaxID=1869339 RepID=UPI0025E5BD67|nr:SDR family oxidoreductase [Polaromonas sp.]MBI2727440.1 SDR family oxidoreductase [Polaromonas sp.]
MEHKTTSIPEVPPLGRLKGRRIVVTGAGSGIGAAIAQLFIAEGAQVAAIDRNEDGIKAWLKPGSAGNSIALKADIADESSVNDAVKRAAEALGGIDGLVNAAGVSNTDLLRDVSLADWKRTIDINLTGSFLVSRACLPWLETVQNSTIVNFSSGQGLQPFVRRGAYAASKAGVISLSKTLAMEWAPIRVNTICPGAVDTPMVRAGYTAEALQTQVGARYALGRVAEPIEIARAALYLTGSESSFVTGIALAVDGGRSYH